MREFCRVSCGTVEILKKVVRTGLIEKMTVESIFEGDMKSSKAL